VIALLFYWLYLLKFPGQEACPDEFADIGKPCSIYATFKSFSWRINSKYE